MKSHMDGIGPSESIPEDFERMYVELAEAMGYVNRAEGGGGYAVADHSTVLDAIRKCVRDEGDYEDLGKRAEAAIGLLREQPTTDKCEETDGEGHVTEAFMMCIHCGNDFEVCDESPVLCWGARVRAFLGSI